MAVVTFFMSDLDKNKQTFTSKKEADAHDKMLQSAYAICDFLVNRIEAIDEQIGEEIGLLLANNAQDLDAVMKGKLDAFPEKTEEEPATNENGDNEGQTLTAVS